MSNIEFAQDYLYILGLMNIQSNKGIEPISHAAAMVFLIDWGLTPAEVDAVNKKFWEDIEKNTLEDADVVKQRIIKRLKGNEGVKKRVLRQLAAIASLDGEITEDEINYFKHWGELLDMKPSDAIEAFNKGGDLATALNYFAQSYARNKIK